MRRRAWPVVVLCAIGLVACGDGAGVRSTAAERAQTLVDPAAQADLPVIVGIIDFGNDKTVRDYDGFLTQAIADIDSFWRKTMPVAYDRGWVPIEGGIYAAYPTRDNDIPGCGDRTSTYRDVAEGGAFYCTVGDFMAYDDQQLLPDLAKELGEESVAIVIAHEFGHAVQARADAFDQPTVLLEQQADCFAGAWTAHVANGDSNVLHFDDDDIRRGLIAMIEFRDPVEFSGDISGEAHGTGFDRVGAFQDGFVGGAKRCADFPTENRLKDLVDIPFETGDPSGGNLQLVDPTGAGNDLITLLPQSLDAFWTAGTAGTQGFEPPVFKPFDGAGPYPQCDGVSADEFRGNVRFCPDDNTIYWDQNMAAALARKPFSGDLSVGYLLAVAYSDAVQFSEGSDLRGERRALRNDCLTGAYLGSVVPPTPADAVIRLSAGDLDEAIMTAIARSDASSDTNVLGSAFEKVDAFRTGVLDGLEACPLD